MITTYETGTQYNELNQNILDWHTQNNMQIAWVERHLEFDEEGNLLTRFTQEELNLGVEKVRQYLYTTCCDNLFMKWQAGELDKQEWLDARQAVKDAWQYTGDK